MRRSTHLLLILAMVTPAFAGKHVSIAEFEQLLATANGRSDVRMAGMLSGLELTQQVNSTRLAQWEREFPGRRAHAEFLALADASAFLNPPEEDIVSIPEPDVQTQRQFLVRAATYVSKAMARLPDLYATRRTIHFKDDPSVPVARAGMTDPLNFGVATAPMVAAGESRYEPLHMNGKSSVVVSYRNGREVSDSAAQGWEGRYRSSMGLTTEGEFGPILAMVIGDALRGNVVWNHWERGVTGNLAVFRYSVPRKNAHWMVIVPNGRKKTTMFPAYHGEISIDPSNGAILRLTQIADFPASYKMIAAAIMVEYGSVNLGNRPYICPLKGVAISKVPVDIETPEVPPATPPVQTRLNDVSFTHYHLFRASMRILPASNTPHPTSVPQPAR